jgi:hypothetical protein
VSRPACDRRPEIVRSVRAGLWETAGSEELRAHAAGCPDCRETVLVAAALVLEREAAEREIVVPDAGLVLWKARLRQRHAAAARAEEPVVYAERIGRVCAIAAVAGLLLWQRHSISRWLEGAGVLTVASIGAALLATALAVYLVHVEE